jgi:hypothetical protein
MNPKNAILLFALFIGLICANAQEKDLNSLKSWTGKYPTDNEGKQPREFFKLPEIQKPLKELLSKRDFKHLTKELAVEKPIQLIKNYLVVEVCYPHYCPWDNAMLAINLESGGIHVGFYEHRGTKEVIRWFYSQSQDKPDEMPREILDEFLYMHSPKS